MAPLTPSPTNLKMKTKNILSIPMIAGRLDEMLVLTNCWLPCGDTRL